MSERKVLNKYYPPDFDPSKIPRMKLPKNRQYTVRLMAPFNMRCATCGEYIYKGKKFNARKEDVEHEDYLGIRIYRFYIKKMDMIIQTGSLEIFHDFEFESSTIQKDKALVASDHVQRVKESVTSAASTIQAFVIRQTSVTSPPYNVQLECTRCLQEISFKTDPRNTDYEIEAGATRNFMALKLAEEQAVREEEEAKEEEANNPMKLLENRTKQSKNEIELLESLEELKDLNRRQQAVDYDTMLLQFDTGISAREREEKMQQLDEEYIKSVKFEGKSKRKMVVEEEVIEEVEDQPNDKIPKLDDNNTTSSSSLGVAEMKKKTPKSLFSSKKLLSGLVKVNKKDTGSSSSVSSTVTSSGDSAPPPQKAEDTSQSTLSKGDKMNESNKPQVSSLSLLGAYSDSDNSDSN